MQNVYEKLDVFIVSGDSFEPNEIINHLVYPLSVFISNVYHTSQRGMSSSVFRLL